MAAPYFPVDFGQLQAEISTQGVCEETFEIGSIRINPIQLNHPNQGIGYRFTEDGKTFVFLTDNELTHRHAGGEDHEAYVRFSAGADLLIHDSEYTEKQYAVTKGWGHSVYTDALRLAMDARVAQFGLFHHNQERTDEELDGMVADCNSVVKSSNKTLSCFAAQPGRVITL
jgi:phosphoribosyl 1,2-cyclic phosphodiesterase